MLNTMHKFYRYFLYHIIGHNLVTISIIFQQTVNDQINNNDKSSHTITISHYQLMNINSTNIQSIQESDNEKCTCMILHNNSFSQPTIIPPILFVYQSVKSKIVSWDTAISKNFDVVNQRAYLYYNLSIIGSQIYQIKNIMFFCVVVF